MRRVTGILYRPQNVQSRPFNLLGGGWGWAFHFKTKNAWPRSMKIKIKFQRFLRNI